jgi:hypothetical protein
MGTVLPFETIHLYHLNLENFLHRHPPLEDAQGDSGNFSGVTGCEFSGVQTLPTLAVG